MIQLNRDDYFIIESYQPKMIETEDLLKYLKWRKSNKVYQLKNWYVTKNVKKLKLRFGKFYFQPITEDLNYMYVNLIFRTAQEVKFWRIDLKKKNSWNKFRYAITKYNLKP